MRLENYSLEKLKSEIREIFIETATNELNNGKIFFFGSRAKNTNSPYSDIDLGYLGATKLSAKVKLEICDKLEQIPMLYKIDFIDFSNVSDKFKKEALKHVEYI